MPDPYDWDSDDEARQQEALRHSMFNTELPGYSLYEGRLSPWTLLGLLVAVAALIALAVLVLRPEVQDPGDRRVPGAGSVQFDRVESTERLTIRWWR